MYKRKMALSIVKLITIIFIISLILFPLYFMIMHALISNEQAIEKEGSILPKSLNFSNFLTAFKTGYWKALLVTIILTILSVSIKLFISITGGYALNVYKNKFIKFLVLNLIWFGSLPEYSLLMGWFQESINLDILKGNNLIISLLMPNVFSLFTILLFKNAFSQIPEKIKILSNVDKLTITQKMFLLYLPYLKSQILVTVIFGTITAWNSFVWPSLILSNQDMNVLSTWLIGIGDMGQYVKLSNIQMAASVLTVIPIIFIYLVFSKKINNSFKNIL
ncbi:MAG: carbohydrate ABC transporter permease [Mycoplasmatales bacterium]|nr:carbohydrate ABC transporter permease [Mycoplasmatales bacterium]